MQQTTLEDRKKELRTLLEQIEQHPEKDWSEQKKRVAVLREMVAHEET